MTEELHEAVRRIVNNADPIGLLALGSPADEYEIEIRDLVRRISAGEEPTEQMVRDVMLHWFGAETQPSEASVQAVANGLARIVDNRA